MSGKVPIYVTRPTGEGLIGRMSIPPGLAWLCLYLVVVNVVAWGVVGLVAVADLIVGWLS